MANAIEKKSAVQTYRDGFSRHVKAAADMTLHELVDQFQRLTKVVNDNTAYDEMQRPKYNEAAILALKERKIFASVANARFGLSLAADSGVSEYDDTW
jgi:signal transduction histidine kinase